jgi:hypothetical protein
MNPLLIAIVAVLLSRPGLVWAIQSHGDPEGLHAHQMAHIFFAFAMGLLIYWLRKRRLVAQQGWRFIQYGALLFIAWNLNAFVGHWLEEVSGIIAVERIDPMTIRIETLAGYEWVGVVFYLVKMDHLLSVPALVFLCLGLRWLLRTPADGLGGENAS